ncbi:MAG TPA: ribonuclease H-like domain-containing protein, partial [Vicinamibacterales bacterium]
MATLDRLREIVKAHRPSAVPVVSVEGGSDDPPLQVAEGRRGGSLDPPDYTRAAIALGGAVVERSDGAVIVVDREYRADQLHGHTPIAEIAATISDGLEAMSLMARAWPAAKGIDGRLLFVDLETTGLFGGAGTQAFLVGCASIEGTSIRIRQFMMPGFEHERAVLSEFETWAKAQGALCTYNGRT